MVLFKASIHKSTGAAHGGKWLNVYTVNAVGPEDAMLSAQNLANAEMICHDSGVLVTAITLHDPSHAFNGRSFDPGGDIFGLRTLTGAVLPLWNVARVRFQDLSFSRPEVKYWRILVGEGDVIGDTFETAVLDVVQAAADAILTVDGVCGPTGETLTSALADPLVKMRQTSWHRKSRPGFKRGYIPV